MAPQRQAAGSGPLSMRSWRHVALSGGALQGPQGRPRPGRHTQLQRTASVGMLLDLPFLVESQLGVSIIKHSQSLVLEGKEFFQNGRIIAKLKSV